ncbi:MAG: DNA repair protein RadC [Caulobacterales bacterium]
MPGRRKDAGSSAAAPSLSEAPLFSAAIDALTPPISEAPSKRARKAEPATASEAPHYEGHRERLRARFKQAGGNALADYELLELLLFRIIPRRDVKPLAKDLLKRFGGLSGVLAAPLPRLAEVDGLSESAALELKILQAAFEHAAKDEAKRKPVVSSWSSLLEYCKISLRHEPREQFRILYLDKRNQLISDEILNHGTVDHAPVYPREVARRALEVSASAIILVHNHPSGDPTPSKADVEITKQVVAATKTVGVTVHDHLVIGSNFTASFKSLGLM